MKSANVSVITVTRNNIGALVKTYESILAQKHKPKEWVVVDGGSDDGTRDWLDKLDSPLNLSWRSEPDLGIYDAMNKGIALATGDFCLFLNAGDYLIGQVLLPYYKCPCFTRCRTVNLLGREIEVKPRSRRLGMPVPHQAIIFPRQPSIRYDLKYPIGADWDFFLRHGLDESLPSCRDSGWVRYSRGGTSDVAIFASLYDILRISWRHFGAMTSLSNGLLWALKFPLKIYRGYRPSTFYKNHD